MNLVTGATGMVGSYLTMQLLLDNEEVVAIYRNIHSIEKTKSLFKLMNQEILFNEIKWEEVDILNINSLSQLFHKYRFENIYHCAALVSFDPNDFDVLIKTNIEGTANMVNFALANKISKFCHVSSIAALGDVEKPDEIIDENTNWNKEVNHNDYSISKYGSEIEVWRAHQEGLSVIIVNPGVVLGAGFWHTGSGKIFSQLQKNSLFYTNGVTGFIDVEDLVKIMILLIKTTHKSDNYIVISENLSYHELIKLIAKSFKLKQPKYKLGTWVTQILYQIDWLYCFFTNSKRKFSKSIHLSLHSKNYYFNKKLQSTVDYPLKTIEESIKSIKKYRDLIDKGKL
ncbi:MAG: NAD-dependent epimerase/dehydratase family protein [Flavobacterium sp.]